MEWSLTLNDNWPSLKKKWLNFQYLGVRFQCSKWFTLKVLENTCSLINYFIITATIKYSIIWILICSTMDINFTSNLYNILIFSCYIFFQSALEQSFNHSAVVQELFFNLSVEIWKKKNAIFMNGAVLRSRIIGCECTIHHLICFNERVNWTNHATCTHGWPIIPITAMPERSKIRDVIEAGERLGELMRSSPCICVLVTQAQGRKMWCTFVGKRSGSNQCSELVWKGSPIWKCD